MKNVIPFYPDFILARWTNTASWNSVISIFFAVIGICRCFCAHFFFARGLGTYDRTSGKSGYTIFGRRLRYSSHFKMAPTALKFYREVVLLCFLCIYNADSFASWHMQNISFCAKIFVTPRVTLNGRSWIGALTNKKPTAEALPGLILLFVCLNKSSSRTLRFFWGAHYLLL